MKAESRVLVKICGITRLKDAEAAVSLGADAVGFIFWPRSPRCVDAARVRGITDRLPGSVMKVGVFVNQPEALLNSTAEDAGLTHFQLHGEETPAFARTLTRPVIKAASGPTAIDRWPPETMWLVDAHDPESRGGTGRTSDWSVASALARTCRVWLAGGLTPQNVAGAIDAVRPFGVDVSSGVETSPGIKDFEKLSAFFKAVTS